MERSPLLDTFKRGEVNRDLRLLAAQGGVAPRAEEQLELLVVLTSDGEPTEAPSVSFSADLRKIHDREAHELRFHAEAERRRRENLLVIRSDYRAPFGSFSGTLPGGVALAHGFGVVEHHRAVW